MNRLFNEAILPVLLGTTLVLAAAAYLYGKAMTHSDVLFQTDVPVVQIGKQFVRVLVADTEDKRTRGLSGRTELPEKSGMLFIFDKADFHGIWMKDMFIPIDIIWVDNQFRVVNIEPNVLPSSYPKVFEPDTRARFVIETPALYTAAYGVKVGDRVVLPKELIPKDLK